MAGGEDREGWRDTAHRVLLYFGLVDDEPAKEEQPSLYAPWWLTIIRAAPPLVLASAVAGSPSLADNMWTWAVVAGASAVTWADAVDSVLWRWLPAAVDRSRRPPWRDPRTYMVPVWAGVVLWLLHEFPHARENVLILATCGVYVVGLGVRKLRERA